MAFTTWTFKGGTTTTGTTTTLPSPKEPTFSGSPWFIPDIAQSSVIRSFKFREVEDGKTLIVVTTHRGDEYSYSVATDVAQEYYEDLDSGGSPGVLWNDLRDYLRRTPKAPEPVEMATVSISGPADQIGLIAAAAEAQGLTIF
jgi:hypothetical protein